MKRLALRSLIASITFSALVGIYILVVGNFGDLEARVLITALSVSALSILAMACGAAYERGKLGRLPQAGVAFSVASFALFMVATWGNLHDDAVYQWAVSLALAGTACAHACLISLATLAPRFHWVRAVGWGSAFSLAGLLTALVWQVDAVDIEPVWRAMGALAIGVAAVTVAIPILHRLSEPADVTADTAGKAAAGARFCVVCGHRSVAPVGNAVHCAGCGTTFRFELLEPGTVNV